MIVRPFPNRWPHRSFLSSLGAGGGVAGVARFGLGQLHQRSRGLHQRTCGVSCQGPHLHQRQSPHHDRKERHREFKLGTRIDAESVEAHYNNGLLRFHYREAR